ncbi:MAG: peptidase MA domain-containing protein, partial [Anaerolineae bacterium]|nr:peptidase MA domain-containing protein [Anaerolineae bacterium]
ALADAIQDDSLISLRVLNSPFPDSRERAVLSYAESNSLVSFIIEEYGSEKLGELISGFAEGAH